MNWFCSIRDKAVVSYLNYFQDQFCAWFGLTQLLTETARVFFLSHFLVKKQLFHSSSRLLYLFNASTRHFCTLFLPSRIKKYRYLVYNSQKFLRV